MNRIDWRSASGYEDLRSLDAPGFAWEFLRRNRAFASERAKLEAAALAGALDPAEEDAFALRWGVRFRERQRRRPGPIECCGPPKPCPASPA